MYFPLEEVMNGTTITPIADYLFGLTELGSVIIGLVLNFLTIPYFNRSKEQFSSMIYLLIVITDICILVCCFPSAIAMLNLRRALVLENRFLCSVTGFVFNIGARMSVFLIAILGCARSVSLIFPFKKQRSRTYMVVISIYLVANIVLASLPLIFSPAGYHYSHFVGQCAWGINELSFVNCFGTDCQLWLWITYCTIIFPWLVPGVVVVMSSAISIITLFRSEKTRRRMAPRRGSTPFTPQRGATMKTKHATITILIMTVVYSVFNMPCWLLYSYLLISGFNPVAWLRGSTALYLQIFVCRLSVAMNSATNPVVYFFRIEALSKLTILRKTSLSNSLISRASNALKLVPWAGRSEVVHFRSCRSVAYPSVQVSTSRHRVSLPMRQWTEEIPADSYRRASLRSFTVRC